MGKATEGTTATRKQTKRLGGENLLEKENSAASNEPIKFRENDYGDYRNRACFTFCLDNNGDILMLIEIIFD